MESSHTSFNNNSTTLLDPGFAPVSIPSYDLGTPSPPTSLSGAGRKRSRDEASLSIHDEYFPVQFPPQAQAEKEDEWEYGEGMTIIKPSGKGFLISPESQTGTWAEEKADEEMASVAAAATIERPIIRSAKSQRLLDLSSTPTIAEEPVNNGALPTSAADSPAGALVEPTIDDFTRHLGIGWSLLSTDEDIQAAARGWTRFISNHFPITNPQIRLQSRGLASYLVEALEGYFLFREDLRHGQLVSRTLEQTFINLQGPIPIFEGEAVLNATEIPKVNDAPAQLANSRDEVPVRTPATIAQTREVEMDMS